MFFSEKGSLMLSLAHNSSVHLGAGTHKKKCPYCEKETKGLEYHASVYHPQKNYKQNLQ